MKEKPVDYKDLKKNVQKMLKKLLGVNNLLFCDIRDFLL